MSERYKSPEQRRKIGLEVAESLLNGLSVRQIEDQYHNEYGLEKKHIREALIPRVRRDIADTTGKLAEYIVPMHIEMYEEIYAFFQEFNQTKGMLKALSYKEKLMGFHKTDNVVEVNSKKTTVIEKEFNYDVEKLTVKERDRLKELLNKAKK